MEKIRKTLLVVSQNGKNRGYIDYLSKKYILKEPQIIHVDSYPTIEIIESIKSNLKTSKFELIIAIGGGSVLDSAKVLSVFLDKNLHDNLNKVIENPDILDKAEKVQLHVFPTTAGTGAEVTQFATIWDFKKNKKHSLDHQKLLPDEYFLEEKFLETLEGQNLLYPFLDSISHAFESLWNKNRNNESVKYAIDSLNLNLKSLKAFCSKDEMYDFEKMILASNFAGKAINITRTSIAHSISYPLTTKYGIPHGLACSFTIPRIFKYVKNDEIIKNNINLLNEITNLLLNLELDEKIISYLKTDTINIPLKNFLSTRSENFILKINKDLMSNIINQNSFNT
jgi:alcohol dehydrogenase